MRSLPKHGTTVVLLAIGALHAAWGRGSSFPFKDRQDLAEAVIGGPRVPSPAACYSVAVALVVAAGLVGGPPGVPPRLRRVGVAGVALALAARGGLGLAGWTDVVSPGSSSRRFRTLDRRLYSPLCLALSAGAVFARPRGGH